MESFRQIPESFLRWFADSGPFFLVGLDMKGRIIFANELLRVKTGRPGRSLRGESFVESLVSPEDRQCFLESFHRATQSHAKIAVEAHMKTSGAPPLFVQWHLSRVEGSDVPSPPSEEIAEPHIHAIGVDVTEQRRAQRALRERVKELTCLHDMTAVMERNLPLSEALQAFAERIPPAYQRPKEVTARIRLGDEEFESSGFRETACCQRAPILVGGEAAGDATVCSLAPGAGRPEEYFIGEEDELLRTISGRLGIYVDHRRTTEALTKSEEKYRALVEDLEDVVFSLDDEGRFVFVSGAARKYGFEPDSLIGKRFIDFVVEEDLAGLEESFLKTLSGEIEPYEFRAYDGQGEIHHVRTSSRAVREDGRTVGITGVLIDVTEQRRAEAQLRVAQKMEAVGRLAGGVAHDFNNLLTVINNYAELGMRSLNEADPLHSDLEEIAAAGRRAARLTEQLLAFSRKQMLTPEVIRPAEIVARIESMLGRLIGEDIVLAVEVSGGGRDGCVEVDPNQLEQVIMNLAVNARDAMPRGGGLSISTLNVTLEEGLEAEQAIVPPGRYVKLEIADTGVGMDEPTRARLFEPFFTTKDKGHGTGLGLATVYGIVKQSDGHITVESTPGEGTAFEIYFPRVEDSPSTTTADDEKRAEMGGAETILVAEDEEQVRNLAKRILESAGYRVLTAKNGGEALRFCEQEKEPIALLLTDVIMPEMSGKVLSDRLAHIRPEIKVLYMSGYTGDVIAGRGVEEPRSRVVTKPFTASSLKRRVREKLDEA
jgi:PAS domain S-box-containing protein